MPVVVKEAPRIGMSNKMIVETVFYANRRKCLTDTMIASARTGMIAVPHVAQKTRLVLTARLVVRQPKYVKTRCLPFVAPTAIHASTEAVAQRRMRMRRNVVPTVSELTAPVVQSILPLAPKQQPMKTDAKCVKRDAPETNRFLANPVPIPGVAQKEILVVQLSDSVVWAVLVARERRTVKFFERENVVAMPVVLEHFIKFK